MNLDGCTCIVLGRSPKIIEKSIFTANHRVSIFWAYLPTPTFPYESHAQIWFSSHSYTFSALLRKKTEQSSDLPWTERSICVFASSSLWVGADDWICKLCRSFQTGGFGESWINHKLGTCLGTFKLSVQEWQVGGTFVGWGAFRLPFFLPPLFFFRNVGR